MYDTSGSFCNDGSKGNEDVKKAKQINVGLTSKTTTLHMQHTFLFISFHLLSMHDYNVKFPHSTLFLWRT